MKTIATRILVISASVIALGTTAFGQNRMTAEVPFAFKTSTGTFPAGTYQFDRTTGNGLSHAVIIRNVATQKGVFAGNPMFNAYSKATDAPIAVFVCGTGGCALKALRTREGSAEYQVPKSKDHEKVAEISVPLKAIVAD